MKTKYTKLTNALLALVLVLSSSLSLMATSPRIVVIEHFTNSSCGPCAQRNPQYFQYIAQNKDKVFSVSYHVNWPGANDPMHLFNTPMNIARTQYYGVTGVPAQFLNGNVAGDFGGANASKIGNYLGETSPIDIEVNHTIAGGNINVHVKVTSASAISNHKLRVIAMEELIKYSTPPGNNGEKDFDYVPRMMFPDHNGTSITLAAGQTKEFDLSLPLKSGINAAELFIAAYIQNDATKEILQGARNQPKEAVKTTVTVSNPYLKVQENGEVTKSFSVKNENPFSVDVKLQVADGESLINDGWEITFDKTDAKLPANGTITGNVTIKPNGKAGLAYIALIADPVVTDPEMIGVPTSGTVYALSSATKYMMLLGYSASDRTFPSFTQSDIYSKSGIMPLTKEFTDNYDLSDFEMVWLNADVANRGVIAFDQSNIVYPKLTAAIQAGTNVVFTSNLGLFNAYYATGAPTAAAKTFFNNVLGIGMTGVQTSDVAPTIAGNTIYPLNAAGIQDDILGKGIAYTANTTTANYTPGIDIINILDNKKATPFLLSVTTTQGNVVNNIRSGTRHEIGESKVVFMNIGLDLIENPTERLRTMNQIFKWVAPQAALPQPQISADTEELDFGSLALDAEAVTKTIEISNTGGAVLSITDIFLSWEGEGFTMSNLPEFPKDLAIGDKFTFDVTFKPEEDRDLSDNIYVESNDPVNPALQIRLKGVGLAVGATPVLSVDTDALVFGEVAAGLDMTKEFKITNTGNADLVISSLTFDPPVSEFTFVNNANNITVSPNQEYTVSVKFSPNQAQPYSTNTIIASNDLSNPNKSVALSGVGTGSSVDDNGIAGEKGIFTMSAAPNPMVNISTISYELGDLAGAQNVEIKVIDAAGSVVNTLVNEVKTPGTHTVNFESNNLTSGSYYVIATIKGFTTQLPVSIVR